MCRYQKHVLPYRIREIGIPHDRHIKPHYACCIRMYVRMYVYVCVWVRVSVYTFRERDLRSVQEKPTVGCASMEGGGRVCVCVCQRISQCDSREDTSTTVFPTVLPNI